MTGLQRFIDAKQAELTALAAAGAETFTPWAGPRPAFGQALDHPRGGPLAVIAEFKRASPSRGLICASVTPEDAAREYAAAGAAALSVLTEERHFLGRLDDLRRAASALGPRSAADPAGTDAAGTDAAEAETAGTDGPRTGQGQAGATAVPALPLLRKDFLFHPLQVAATAATPASALLLIVRLTPDAHLLRDLREQAEQAGLDAVVEVFDQHDVALARDSGARIIQVNARDLTTFKVDRSACLALIDACPPSRNERWIAASGMTCRADLEAAASAGFSAALVGSALMEHATPGASLRRMLEGKQD